MTKMITITIEGLDMANLMDATQAYKNSIFSLFDAIAASEASTVINRFNVMTDDNNKLIFNGYLNNNDDKLIPDNNDNT